MPAGALIRQSGRKAPKSPPHGTSAPSAAADLQDTGLTVNLLLPGGATVTGMVPPGAVPAGHGFLEPAVMGPPIVWLASAEAAGVHGERIVAAEFGQWLREWKDRR